jgi:type II secretory pathway pseudopilin PulG
MKFLKSKLLMRFFSLIELLIVVAILGALVALILPSMESSEDEAKDTACDYNNYGTLRYMKTFKSINGVYPSGLHTGLTSDAATATTMEGVAGFTAANLCGGDWDTEPTLTWDNIDNGYHGTSTSAALTENQVASLTKAGVAHLAYSTDVPTFNSANVISTSNNVVTIPAGTDWYEDHVSINPDDNEATVDHTAGAEVTINGKKLSDINPEGSGNVIVPLFVSPTVDWDHYYSEAGSAEGNSKVGIGLPGKCPHLAKDAFRYYICLFKVYGNGTAAELIGTLCPECGSLNP